MPQRRKNPEIPGQEPLFGEGVSMDGRSSALELNSGLGDVLDGVLPPAGTSGWDDPERVAARAAAHEEDRRRYGGLCGDVRPKTTEQRQEMRRIAAMLRGALYGGDAVIAGALDEVSGPDVFISRSEEIVPEAPKSSKRKKISNLNRAFGYIPGHFIDTSEIGNFTDLDIERVRQGNLWGLIRNSTKGGYFVDNIALNPREYSVVVRHMGSFVTSIGARVESGKASLAGADSMQSSKTAAIAGALSSKEAAHRRVIDGYKSELSTLEQLVELGKSGKLDKAITPEAELRIMATTATTSFSNIIDVCANQGGWGAEGRNAAWSAMRSKLTSGPQNERIRYFNQLLTIAVQYTKKRKELFEGRMLQINAEASRHINTGQSN